MEIIREPERMQALALRLRREGKRVGLVPTMGALHAGHLSLLEHVRRDCDVIVVSIFVNPIQFGPGEDLERYPRDLEGDAEKLREVGCHVVFAPDVGSVYRPGARTRVIVEELEDVLCGASRPGHFRGVATIVTKLFHLVQPHVAVFGQKDAQQAILLQRMTRDLDFPVELRIAPIVRDPDGLALSSRNAYLDAQQRSEALLLQESLRSAYRLVDAGERDAEILRRHVREHLSSGKQLRIDYVDLVDAQTLRPLRRLDGRALLLLAAWVGKTRLIDNLALEVRHNEVREVALEHIPGEETR
ncbi:MAG: pantoate--beta-alanine ligase [Candidatus Latescibacterota bacterium]|nr:MAG: pantoate--beta-alanine ligase [Candidatus Latescibacterota bacterium]